MLRKLAPPHFGLTMNSSEPRLTSLSHGGGCGCKIAPAVLSEILKGTMQMPIPKELMVGIATADDAAVYKLNDQQALIATTDFFMPIVDDPYDFGRIAATNAISDVYAMGGKPIMALALVGMPINVLSTNTIGKILAGGASVCNTAGIPIAGGHTIDSVEPIYGLVVLGLVHPDRVKRNDGARVGDVLVLGKPLGVGILSAALKKQKLDVEGYASMIANTTKLNTPGPELAELPGVHALTDVTGFGILGHLIEMMEGSGLGATMHYNQLPILDAAKKYLAQKAIPDATYRNWNAYNQQVAFGAGVNVMEAFQILPDPQTNGGLLIAVSPASLEEVQSILKEAGIDNTDPIGVCTELEAKRIQVNA